MFLQLKEGAKEDVETRQKLIKEEDKGSVAFAVTLHNGQGFSVRREGHKISDWVTFRWDASGISVTDKNDKIVQKATLALTDDAECKLKLSTGEQLTCWQFRKRMLEDLFFSF
jgi:predicted polyphosphate/ATP-dependent NAD kinase